MEPSNGSSSKRRSLLLQEEDANILTFRRRNKIIAVVFILLIISLTLFIAALITQLRRIHSPTVAITPLQAFCSVYNDRTCLKTLNPIVTGKSITDPNQIFTLSLQTAANDLQHMINSSLTGTHKFSFSNCSNSLRRGLGRIREPLEMMRVNPFVESMSKEQRDEMKNRIAAAEEDVESCMDDLAESVGEITAKLVNVNVYLNSAVNFVVDHAKMGRMIDLHIVEGSFFNRDIVYLNLFMCGLQFLFIFGLFCSFFRIR